MATNEAWNQWEGRVLDSKFPLRQYLAGGEHSAVFLTRYGAPESQQAAIKLIPVDLEREASELARAEAAARLSHPGLLRIFHVGACRQNERRLVYIVMEYAPEDLSEVLPQRALTPAEAREVLASTLETLAYLHREGFAHTRLKPSNIMAVDDEIKISSDGLRRIGEAKTGPWNLTAYDSPEASRGTVSPAGDVWSLAVTMVEALTQRLPVWAGANLQDLVLPDTLPSPFPEIARNGLRVEPERRWTINRITERLQEEPSASTAPAAVEPRVPGQRRSYVLPGAAAVLVVAGVVLGVRFLEREPSAQQPAPPPAVQTQPPPAPQPEPVQPTLPAPPEKKDQPSPSRSKRASKEYAARATPDSSALESAPASGAVVHKVLPAVPAKARRTIQGTVRVGVRVQADASGRVAEAHLDSPGKSKYFAALALQAAKGWRFAPVLVDGRNAPSAWTVRFEFRRSGTNARAARVSP